jgi:putative membrane protein
LQRTTRDGSVVSVVPRETSSVEQRARVTDRERERKTEMIRTSRAAIAALAFFATASLATAQNAQLQDAGRPGNRAVDDGRGGTETQIDDQVFVTKALAASRAEVELAELALQKSTDPKVRDFAEKMMRDHTGAQAQLLQSATREGIEKPKSLDARHAAAKAELAALDGPDFDRRYMALMVEDHAETVTLYTAKHRTGDGDVAAIANRLTTVMQGHLDMAREVSRAVGNPDDARYGSR